MPRETGSKNYQLSYGACGLHTTHQHNTPHSSWYVGQKQCYHTTSDSVPHASHGMKKRRQTKHSQTTKTQSMKQETRPSHDPRGTKISSEHTRAIDSAPRY